SSSEMGAKYVKSRSRTEYALARGCQVRISPRIPCELGSFSAGVLVCGGAFERARLRSAARPLFTLKAVAVPPRCGNYGFKTTGFPTAVRILVSTAACAARLLIRGLPEAQNRYGSVVRKGERQQPTVPLAVWIQEA